MAATLEIFYEIHNVDYHQTIKVGPDPDGLGLIELTQIEDGKQLARLTFPKDSGKLIAESILAAMEKA